MMNREQFTLSSKIYFRCGVMSDVALNLLTVDRVKVIARKLMITFESKFVTSALRSKVNQNHCAMRNVCKCNK